MVVTGQRFAESWASAAEAADFFDLKGDLESLLALTRAAGDFVSRPAARRAAPGTDCPHNPKGAGVGYMGALHPTVGADLGLHAPLYACEIDLEAVLEAQLARI